ncbi:FecR family protein [Pseudomonas sp. NPDC089395]|uniref:FecR family protein n=1 Tax=Pseudomonas sp. NPDC089395 TaxID=3364460 RepID=UPI0038206024
MPIPSQAPHTPAEMAADWCVRLHLDECTDADRAEFLRWYDADPVHAQEYRKMCRVWQVSEQLPARIATPVALSGRRRRPTAWLARAAVLLLAVAGAWSAGWSWGVLPGSVRYYMAEENRRQVQLPDHSEVELNRRTGLLYLGYRDQREVLLHDGEAYFDVRRDLDKPFLISTDNARVRVTGTHFNVWTAQAQTTVTVTEGTVLVSRIDDGEGHNQGAELTAGMQASVRHGGMPQLGRTDPSRAQAWRNGKLVLDDISLRDALPQINRYLDVPLQLDASSAAGELRFGGIYDTRDLAQLVDALPRVLPVKLRRGDGVIMISSR